MKSKKDKFRIVTKPSWCKGCGICVAFCPAKCLELDHQGKIILARPDDCIKCGQCELRCPDFAIFLAEIEEIEKNKKTGGKDE